MEAVEEWEEEECGSLKVRSRKSIIENLEANQDVVQVVQVVGESGNGRNPEANEGEPVQLEVEPLLRESESCVYLDREKGLWKCRHCVWTYRMESPGIDYFQYHEDCSNGVMNAKTSSQQGSCFGLQSEGIESADEITGTKFISVTLFTDEKKPANDEADFDTKNIEIQTGIPFVGDYGSPEHMKTENQSTLPMVFSEGQHEDGTAKFEPIMDRSSTNTNGSLVDAGKIVVEMDVERVLEEQETHDLYCPNCNSCITKRVILRKRKRVVRELKLDAKREKTQPLLLQSGDVETSPDAAIANDLSGSDVFRCLSCFSFFIPTATFGRNNESPSSQSPQQTPTKNLNCISSIFEMFTGKLTGNEPGSGTAQIESNRVNLMNPSSLLDGTLLEEENYVVTSNPSDQCPQNIENDGARVKDLEKKPLEDDKNIPTSLTPEALVHGDALLYVGEKFVENDGARVKDLEKKPLEDDKNILTSLTPAALVHGEALLYVGEKLVENDGARVKDLEKKPLEDDKNIWTSTTPEALVYGEALLYVGEKLVENDGATVKDLEKKPLEDDKNILTSLTPEALVHGEALLYVGEKLVEPPKKSISGYISTNPNGDLLEKLHPSIGKQMDDLKPKPVEEYQKTDLITSRPEALVIGKRKIDFEEILEDLPHAAVVGRISPDTPGPSEIKDNVPTSVAPLLLGDTRIDMPKQRADDGTIHKWEILKSIVYGGLVESITSLGVVSSAAGSDATTLNIVALGVANLISGLIVILQSLRDLKNDQHSSIDQEGEKLDRYEATLGRKENFWLHATVSVLSYIMFGVLPPIIYGFSFRKSDNKEYKLIAVAAASLLCIILLAAGKAHVRKAPKNYIRTILYYVGIGVAASGLSYVVGVLFKKLFEKLGWFDSSAATPASSNLAFPETIAMNSRWASY